MTLQEANNKILILVDELATLESFYNFKLQKLKELRKILISEGHFNQDMTLKSNKDYVHKTSSQ